MISKTKLNFKIMTKELFVSTINSIKKQIEIDRKNSSMLL